jgi:RNA polymerase sigma factor (sigma-70 family)
VLKENQPDTLVTPREGEEIALREAERFVVWLCRRYQGREDYEDLLQLARIGALRAIRTHDPSRGELNTLIAVSVRSELARHFVGQNRKCRACPGRLVSLDDPVDEDGNELGDFVADDRRDVAAEVVGRLYVESILGSVKPERTRQALALRLEGATLETAGIEMGVSRERVRQLEAKALQEIRRSRLARVG